MSKRIIAFLLTVVIAISCFPLGVFAAEGDEDPMTPETALIYVESTYCVIGREVDVNICIAKNPGIAGARFNVSFDEKLTLIGVSEDDGVFGVLDYTAPNALGNGCPFNWDSLDAEATENGKILTLTFALDNDVVAGDQLDINVSYNYGDIYDVDLNSIAVTMIGGTLDVIDYLPGDANSDGVVNGKDITVIRRYNADWDIEIDLRAADANGDGEINGKDVTWLRRYLAEWEGYDPIPTPVVCAHSLTAIEAKEPTCTEAGNTAYWVCSLCDAYFSDAQGEVEIELFETVIAANGHSYEAWQTTKEATCVEEGSRERACSVCNGIDYDTIEINSSNHPSEALEVIPGYDATFDEQGLSDGERCTACDCVFREQVTIPAGKENAVKVVYWYNYDNKKEEIILNKGASEYVIAPETREGYEFLGWFKEGATEPTTVVITNQADENGILNLFAKWDPIKYTITYKDAPVNNNPEEYTVKDSFVLSDPEWSGLLFVNWTDENHTEITHIPAGTTGNITLTANWKTHENLVVQNQNGTFVGGYIPQEQKYLFIYDIGTIYNVVLDSTMTPYRKTTNSPMSVTISQTVSVEESHAENIALAISKSITNSIDWNNTSSSTYGNSVSESFSFSSEMGGGIKDTFESKLSSSYGVTFDQSWEWSSSTSVGRSEEVGSEETKELSSTIAYAKQMSLTKEITHEITEAMPDGNYYGVHAGDIRVFAVVIYDPIKEEYNLTTYNVLENMHDMILYEELYQQYEEKKYDTLAFSIPTDKISEVVDSSYCIKYDANGGEGEMPISIHPYNEDSQLLPNAYTNNGYLFAGWEYINGEEIKELGDEASIFNLVIPNPEATKTDTITLKAKWVYNMYTVVYDSNGGTGGEMQSSTYVCGANVALATNQFNKTGYTFVGWNTAADGSGTSYTDEQVVCIATVCSETITLYAQWKANTYTVVYHANGGGGSTTTSSHTYGVGKALSANGFSRTGWTFSGWSMYPNGGVQYGNQQTVTNLTSEANGVVNLYAVWDIIACGSYTNGGTKVNEDSYHTVGVDVTGRFDLQGLKEKGYSTVEITVTYDITYLGSTGNSYVVFGVRSASAGDVIIGESGKTEFSKNSSPKNVVVASSTSIDNLMTYSVVIAEFRATMDYSPWSNNEHTVSNIRLAVSFR